MRRLNILKNVMENERDKESEIETSITLQQTNLVVALRRTLMGTKKTFIFANVIINFNTKRRL